MRLIRSLLFIALWTLSAVVLHAPVAQATEPTGSHHASHNQEPHEYSPVPDSACVVVCTGSSYRETFQDAGVVQKIASYDRVSGGGSGLSLHDTATQYSHILNNLKPPVSPYLPDILTLTSRHNTDR